MENEFNDIRRGSVDKELVMQKINRGTLFLVLIVAICAVPAFVVLGLINDVCVWISSLWRRR